MKYIHINQHIIKHNKKYGTNFPPCRVQEGIKSRYCMEVEIKGSSKMVYSSNNPLACGARVWIETNAEVVLIGEKAYKEINFSQRKDRENVRSK